MPLWYVKGRENFPFHSGYTKAKKPKKASQNVGWRSGLRGGDLKEFIETANVTQVAFMPKQEAEEPGYTLEDLLRSATFLREIGIDHSVINSILEEEIKKAREAGKEQQLWLFPPPQNKNK